MIFAMRRCKVRTDLGNLEELDVLIEAAEAGGIARAEPLAECKAALATLATNSGLKARLDERRKIRGKQALRMPPPAPPPPPRPAAAPPAPTATVAPVETTTSYRETAAYKPKTAEERAA